MSEISKHNAQLIDEIRELINQSRQQVAVSVNSAMSLLYWRIGKRINEEILENKRAEYGKEIVAKLSLRLEMEYGKGYSKRQLHLFIRFAEVFPSVEIVHTLCTQLSWSQIRQVIPIESELKRQFYVEMCKHEKWSVRTFQERINSMLYERTAISKKPEKTIENELAGLKNDQKLSADLKKLTHYAITFLLNHHRPSQSSIVSLFVGKQHGTIHTR